MEEVDSFFTQGKYHKHKNNSVNDTGKYIKNFLERSGTGLILFPIDMTALISVTNQWPLFPFQLAVTL